MPMHLASTLDIQTWRKSDQFLLLSIIYVIEFKYIYIYIYIYIYRGRQKCQLAALQRIFCCSAALLAKVYTIHILLQRCYFSCGWQLAMPYNRKTHTTALLPNNCGPMADGLFRDPKGRSYPHPKYWTHRWRIDINIDHGISPIEPS